MTLKEMYEIVPEFRTRFRNALRKSEEEIRSVVCDVVKMTSSEIEEKFIVENLKEVYQDYLTEMLVKEKEAWNIASAFSERGLKWLLDGLIGILRLLNLE